MTITDSSMAGDTAASKAEFVYRYIYDRILSLELLPGSFIDKSDICAQLGVSRQPVTAALTQLSREGLVEILPQRGSYVMRLDSAYLKQTAFVRGALEAAIASELALAPPADLLVELQQIIDDQRAALAAVDVPKFQILDEAFHRALVHAFGNPDATAKVEAGLTCLRRVFSIAPLDFPRTDPLPDEHQAILDAIARGDRAQAALLPLDHARSFARLVDKLGELHPTLFAEAA